MLASTTNLDRCYQLLGICRGASIDELKTAYRSLARKLHPDITWVDVEAHQRFISLNQAYQTLLAGIDISAEYRTTPAATPQTPARATTTVRVATTTTPATTPTDPKYDDQLKWQLYHELQSLLKQQQFLKAVALIEGLAHHSPQDRQICQWQGIIYAQYGNQLIHRREFDKARIYLKKALKVDPHNRQLWQEVDRGFNRITQLS